MRMMLMVLSLIMISGTARSETNQTDWELFNLKTGNLEQALTEALQVISFFEPQCSWCLKQSQVLNRVIEMCPNLKVNQLGTHGKTSDLKRSVYKMKTQLPTFISNRKIEKKLGWVPATPMTFLLNGEGQVLKKWRGFQTEESLMVQIEKVFDCQEQLALHH